MQADIFNQILLLFQEPLILIASLWVIGIIIAVAIFRRPKDSKGPAKPKKQKQQKQKASKGKTKGPLIKQMRKMSSEAEKGKDLSVPPVSSRHEIITGIFESKLSAIGLQASTSSDYVPVSHTPLARFLKDLNVSEDIVSAIIAGIMEEETEDDVKIIIEAASPELGLVGDELENAKDLAVEEWRNVKRISGS